MTEHETQNLDDSKKLDLILERLTALEQKVEDRSRETRPMWHQALAGIEEIKKEMELMNRHMASLGFQLGRTTARTEALEDRVTKLEGSSGIQ
jgi:hypothetical protein